MRSYKFKRYIGLTRTRRTCFLVDVSDDVIYYINIIGERTYFAKDNEFRTIEEGEHQYLDGTCILCSENLIPYIYK